MKKKRTYQADRVEHVRIAELLPLVVAGCIVALDVAKEKFVVAIATLAGEVVKLFRFSHPSQSQEFLAIVEALRIGVEPGKLRVAMEPTGTYGDALRQHLVSHGVPVFMVSPQRTHDSQAVFDGVRSLHDPKSAALVAKLCSMDLATKWTPPSTMRTRLRALVDLRHHEQTREEVCFGRLEATLARHWPEFGHWMDVRHQKTALRLLVEFTSPARAAEDANATTKFLLEASRGRLAREVIEGIVASASSTIGVKMVEEEVELVRTLANGALEADLRARQIEVQIKKIGAADEVFARLEPWMGTYTAAVMTTFCDPRKYDNARQLEKACGLNLREKSSGEHAGRLSITKRGPGVARLTLYLFALRMIQSSPIVRAWYMRRRGYTEESKRRAVVAVMRKLVRATFHVARGTPFDATKLFDVRRLDIHEEAGTPSRRAFQPRTTPRIPSRRSKRMQRQVVARAST
jgi:transposase